MIRIEVNTKKGVVSVSAGGDLMEIAADMIMAIKLMRQSLAENVDEECAEGFEHCLKSAFKDGIVFDNDKLHMLAERITSRKKMDEDDGIHVLGEDDLNERTSQHIAD